MVEAGSKSTYAEKMRVPPLGMEAEYWAGDNPCERGEIEKFGRFVK